MRVLCAGDLHLGRRSSRLPAHVDGRALSCAAAWEAIVELAEAQRVDVVALSGDLVDEANRYYEALGPLERGLRRLAAAGVVTVAVAGNHDHDVLPALARTLPDGCLRLLGAGGRWERTTVTGPDGAPRLHVDGWSFPERHVRASPLASYRLPLATDAPVLGLLHAELDLPASAYAPVTLAELRARPVALWLLGHVHAPRLVPHDGRPAVLYPGSPQPMDPGEPGAHGAWIVELAPGAVVAPRLVPLATVRYDALDVDVGAAADVDAVRELAIARLREAAAAMVHGAPALRHLSLRLRLVGRTALHRRLEREGRALAAELELPVDGVDVHVEQVVVATRPARDLDRLAGGTDAASLLARLLRDLEAGAPVDPELARSLDAVPAALHGARAYRTLAWDDDEMGSRALRDALAAQAGLLLDELLAQREGTA